MKGNTTTVHMP